MEEGRTGFWLPQVESDDDFVVAPEIAALLHRPPYSKYWLCTCQGASMGSVIKVFGGLLG